jgi:tRNA (guanine-N7-)-methyltransferase
MSKRLKEYPDISIDLSDLCEPADLTKIFGRSAPVHLEIGSGKGTFLVSQAQAQPDVNFLGIEWARKYYRHAVDRMGRWNLTNVRLIRAEAKEFLIRYVPDESVSFYHIYYPDPWPKKRHHKRRFICPDNIEHLLRTLVRQGRIQFVTDHEDYFQWAKEAFADFTDRLNEVEFITAAGAEEGETVGTNFERKYVKEKRGVFTLAFEKK